jgi:hypothetical protein
LDFKPSEMIKRLLDTMTDNEKDLKGKSWVLVNSKFTILLDSRLRGNCAILSPDSPWYFFCHNHPKH